MFGFGDVRSLGGLACLMEIKGDESCGIIKYQQENR